MLIQAMEFSLLNVDTVLYNLKRRLKVEVKKDIREVHFVRMCLHFVYTLGFVAVYAIRSSLNSDIA